MKELSVEDFVTKIQRFLRYKGVEVPEDLLLASVANGPMLGYRQLLVTKGPRITKEK